MPLASAFIHDRAEDFSVGSVPGIANAVQGAGFDKMLGGRDCWTHPCPLVFQHGVDQKYFLRRCYRRRR